MVRSVGGSAAEGIESGFRMGLQMDQLGEDRRRATVRETREHGADMRAAEELELRKKKDEREERRLDTAERHAAGTRAGALLETRQAKIVEANKARQLAGQPIDPEMAKEYGSNAAALQKIRQDALDYFSRVQMGQVDPTTSSSKEVYTHLVAATGMRPEELQQVPQHIADVQAGIETGNQGLLIKGVNGVMAPRLRKGIGQPSPHGGTIIRKEVIGLDPARDANGVDHPDKFIPRLRVYVQTDDGQTRYYDAPATEGGGTDPDDKVNAVSIGSAMEFMGQMGTLATTMQHPAMQAKLAEGGSQLSKQEQAALDELTALSRPTKRKTVSETIDQGTKKTLIRRYEDTGEEVGKREEFKVEAKPMNFRPASAGGASRGLLQMKLEALDEELVANLENATSQEERDALNAQYKEDRRAVLTSIKPTRDSTKGPSNAEQNSAVNVAEQMVADKLKLKYDATLKVYKNLDGTSATPAQLEKLSAARAAANKAVRDASAKKERVSGTDLDKIAKDAAGDTSTPKFETGKVYTNAAGKQAKFGGVDAQGKNIWLAP